MKVLQRLKIAIARQKLSTRKVDIESANYLEEWIHSRIRTTFKSSPEFRSKIGRGSLEKVDQKAFREYQLFRFREQLKYVEENSIFYKKKLKEAGIKPEDIQTFDDLEKVPLTDPNELAEEPFHFLCTSQSKIMRAFTTSGTTGKRKRLFFTQADILNIIDAISSELRTIGMRDNDVLQIMFPSIAAWDPGLMLDGACKVAGINSVIASMVEVDEQIKTMKDNNTTVMIGLTSFIYRITLLAKDKYDLRSMGMKAIICSAEPLSEAMRQEIENAWGCKALSQYGMTEMGLANAIECPVQDGMHYDGADLLIEVIDPETGKHVKEREPGELVITSLNIQGTPLIRYRTYDLSMFIEPPCPCGFQTVGKIGKVTGRLDTMTKIGFGEKIYPLLFDEAILSVPGVLNYRLLIETSGYKDRLTFHVEMNSPPEGTVDRIAKNLTALLEIQNSLDNDLVDYPIVQIVEPGAIGFTPKSTVIVDNRKIYDGSAEPVKDSKDS